MTAVVDSPFGSGARPATWQRRTVLRWTLGGVALGVFFPILAVAVVGHGFGIDAAIEAHRRHDLLYIIDTAPFVLSACGWVIGRAYARVEAARRAVEQTVDERTAELQSTVEELGATQGRLLQAQKLESIGQLAAGVAHEINTPIQYVGDNTRFLQDSFGELLRLCRSAQELAAAAIPCPGCAEHARMFERQMEDADVEFLLEEVPASVNQTLEGVDRVAEIVRALKDFAHPGSDELVPVDLNKAVTNTLAVARNEWKYVADVVTHLDPAVSSVPGLAGPLNQALLILIVNAAQAIGEHLDPDVRGKGTITITTRAVEGFAEIEVRDDGPGIPEEIRERIFDHFFTTKEIGKGSGQGLSIARAVAVDQHGGDLTLSTEVGVGTAFTLRLPLRAGSFPV